MTSVEYKRALTICSFGHHKIRQNKYGICWCVRCGLLVNSSNTYQLIQETDKLTIIQDGLL